MGKKSSEKRRRREGGSTAKMKGSLVEQIVARLHQTAGVTVGRNVRLPVTDGSGRRREIDVLLTTEVLGYPVRFAIECKNEKDVVGAPKIDAYIGKLQDVGIPVQYGIYISVEGYSSGALSRAKTAGIRTLVLKGLSADRLMSEIAQALQSVVYLLPEVTSISVQNNVASAMNPAEMMMLLDDDGNVRATVPDLIWLMWLNGEIPTELGEYRVDLPIPLEWHMVVDGKREPVISASASVRVLGLVLAVFGQVTQHALLDGEQGSIERFRLNATFDLPEGKHDIATVRTEQELQELARFPGSMLVAVNRVPLPRIRLNGAFWPLSERVWRAALGAKRLAEAGEIAEPETLNLAVLEGSDLKTAWEPIWSGHPTVRSLGQSEAIAQSPQQSDDGEQGRTSL